MGSISVLQGAGQRELAERARSNDFDVYLFRLAGGRAFDWTYRFWHSPQGFAAALQDSGYSGADDVLERLRTATLDHEIRTAVADLQQRFYEDAPAAFLTWIKGTRAVDSRFDVGEPTDPDIFNKLWKWRPAEARKTVP